MKLGRKKTPLDATGAPLDPRRANYVGRDGRVVHAGEIWDAADAFVNANGDLFVKEQSAA